MNSNKTLSLDSKDTDNSSYHDQFHTCAQDCAICGGTALFSTSCATMLYFLGAKAGCESIFCGLAGIAFGAPIGAGVGGAAYLVGLGLFGCQSSNNEKEESTPLLKPDLTTNPKAF